MSNHKHFRQVNLEDGFRDDAANDRQTYGKRQHSHSGYTY